MDQKFKKLEEVLRTAKPADVELPSHQANLRRALLASKGYKANYNDHFLSTFLKLSLLPLTVVAMVGIATYIIQNQKTPVITHGDAVQAIPNNVTDNVQALNANNIDLVQLVTPVVQGDAVDMAGLPTYTALSDIDLHKNYFYTKYYYQQIGLEIMIPKGFEIARTSIAYGNDETFQDKISFTYKGVENRSSDYQFIFDYMNISVYKNYDLEWLDSTYATSTGEVKMIGGIAMQVYKPLNEAGEDNIYIFLGRDGHYHAIETNIIRNNVADGGLINDSQAKAEADLTLYREVLENILKSVDVSYTSSSFVDYQGGYSLSIPDILSTKGTSSSGNVFWSIFELDGRYSKEDDTVVVSVIRNFDEMLSKQNFAQYIKDSGQIVRVNGITLKLYLNTYQPSYEPGAKYYVFTGADGKVYAIYLRAVRNLHSGSSDVQALVDYEQNKYETIVWEVLNSLKSIPVVVVKPTAVIVTPTKPSNNNTDNSSK